MKIQVYLLSILSLAMAAFLLVHFGMIWVYGRFYIYESNSLILILETVGIVAVLAFSFYCMIDQLRKSREKLERPYSSRIIYAPGQRPTK